MALNAPISSDATPLNQPSAHQLGGLQKQAEFKERLQPAGRTERKKASLSALYHVLVQCTRRLYFCTRAACDLCAFLRPRFAQFLAVANHPTVCRYNTSVTAYTLLVPALQVLQVLQVLTHKNAPSSTSVRKMTLGAQCEPKC